MDAKYEPLVYLLSIMCFSATLAGLSHVEWQSVEAKGVAALKSERYAEAENLLKSGLNSANRLSLSQDNVIISLDNLAHLYTKSGKLKQAESLYRRSLAMKEAELGANNPALVGTLNNLAMVLELNGKYLEAEPLYKRSVAIMEDKLGHRKYCSAKALAKQSVEQYRRDDTARKPYAISAAP